MTMLVKYDDRGVPFFAWLLRLARNAAIDHLRSQRSTPMEEVVGAQYSASDEGPSGHALCAPRWRRCPTSSARS